MDSDGWEADKSAWTRWMIREICPTMITPSRTTTGWRMSERKSDYSFSHSTFLCQSALCPIKWYGFERVVSVHKKLCDSEVALVTNEFEAGVLRRRKWSAEVFHKPFVSVARSESRKSKFPAARELQEVPTTNRLRRDERIRQSNSIPFTQLAEVFINAHISQIDHLIFIISAPEPLPFSSLVQNFCTEDGIWVDLRTCLVAVEDITDRVFSFHDYNFGPAEAYDSPDRMDLERSTIECPGVTQ
jgi:hypothetical protein